jgi:hypothetical protein
MGVPALFTGRRVKQGTVYRSRVTSREYLVQDNDNEIVVVLANGRTLYRGRSKHNALFLLELEDIAA